MRSLRLGEPCGDYPDGIASLGERNHQHGAIAGASDHSVPDFVLRMHGMRLDERRRVIECACRHLERHAMLARVLVRLVPIPTEPGREIIHILAEPATVRPVSTADLTAGLPMDVQPRAPAARLSETERPQPTRGDR